MNLFLETIERRNMDFSRPYWPDREGIVSIGNAKGKIAIYCDESEAIDLAHLYHSEDGFRNEILEAVEAAYPKEQKNPEDEEWPVCPRCKREGTMSDGHVFDGADTVEWWCENCNEVLKKIPAIPSDYRPVIFW